MPKQKAPKNETKAEKFKRLATQRTNRVLDDLRLVGNLSNRATYSYPDEDVKRMFKAIEDQLKSIKARFRKGPKRKEFQL